MAPFPASPPSPLGTSLVAHHTNAAPRGWPRSPVALKRCPRSFPSLAKPGMQEFPVTWFRMGIGVSTDACLYII